MKSKHRRLVSALTVLALLLALLVLNMLLNRLPQGLDLSSSGIYEISELSREYTASLDEDIDIVIISSAPDARIVKFAQKYARLSEHLSLRTADPVYEPSVLSRYGAEEQTVVFSRRSTGKSVAVNFTDIVQYDLLQYAYYGEYKETVFDADSRFTNAIASVLSESSKTAYCVSGHGETDLPRAVSGEMEKSRFSVRQLNLLTAGGVPEDCELLIFNAPLTDLAGDELEMLDAYLDAGGHCVLLVAEDDGTPMPNWDSLLRRRGMELADGLVGDSEAYYQNEYLIFPSLSTSSPVTGRVSGGRSCLLNHARGISLSGEVSESGCSVKALLETSERGYLVTEQGQSGYGVITVGASSVSRERGEYLFVLPASLIDSTILSNYGNVCNLEVYMNAVTEGFESFNSFTIAPVSLSMSYNAIPHAYAGTVAVTAVLPALLLCFGVIRVFLRRRR